MIRFECSKISVPYRDRNEDRIAILGDDIRTIVVVADGAGGVGSGAAAAASVIREIEHEYEDVHSADQWSTLLKQIDCRISDGQSTAVVVDLRPNGIAGSSVGDCQAWVISNGEIDELTRNQRRKPLLGTGDAEPISFAHTPLHGYLLVGSDGFFNYAKRDQILATIARTEFVAIAQRCVDLVRLPSGDLWDDTSIIAVRPVTRRQARQRYEL